MSPWDIMVVQKSCCAYTPLESIYHNIFVIILFLYYLESHTKKKLTLVSILYCVSFGHFKIRTLLSQGDKTGIFNTVQTRLWSKENIVNIKLLLLYRVFQIFHMFILGQFWRLYKFSFMTRIFFKSIIEPPIVSYFKTI